MTETKLPGHPVGRKFLLWLLGLLMKLLLRLEVVCPENIPATGPVILIINHIAFLDPILVCGISSRPVTPVAKREAFDSFFIGPIMKIYGAIPVRRGEPDLKAIRDMLRVLEEGGVVLLAPEGTRSPTYQMQPAKAGIALLARRSGAIITPVGISGTHRLKSYWTRLRRAPIRLQVGQPFHLRQVSANGRASRAELAVMTDEIMYRLAAQLPPALRGVYDDLEQATEEYITDAISRSIR